jgi:nitroimidazol reductase NimA-like FMN-containing flavoprotein (pyridoxamine 5'-phosphate oxidase superfamily)
VSQEKKKGPLDQEGILKVLAEADTGFLATLGADGSPHVVPLNFVELDGKIYFHGPARGQKIDDIERDPRVSFSAAVTDRFVHGAVPCDTATIFRSVVAEGAAALNPDKELAIRVLAALTRKYAPMHESPAFEEDRLARTFIIEVTVTRWTGKYHR